MLIEANLLKKFSDIAISADFRSAGGVTVFFGPSGAGKSSIINMLAGLVQPDKGNISVNGRLLFDSEKKINLPPEKRGAGYVFQDSRLFPHMSVLKNILYGTAGKPPSKISLEQVSDLLGIAHLLDRYPHNLSGGEKQRVALARALMSSPDFLLMDEPMASLDGPRREELIGYISDISTEFQLPIVYVTHTVDEIIRLASQVGLMREGRLCVFGSAVDILNTPEMMSMLPEREFGVVWEGTVTSADAASGIGTVDFGGGHIEIASSSLKKGARVRFKIPAIDVVVSGKAPDTSARNIFSGTIRKIREQGPLSDIMFDIGGSTLWARITSQSARDMALSEGGTKYAIVKSVAASQALYEIKG